MICSAQIVYIIVNQICVSMVMIHETKNIFFLVLKFKSYTTNLIKESRGKTSGAQHFTDIYIDQKLWWVYIKTVTNQ